MKVFINDKMYELEGRFDGRDDGENGRGDGGGDGEVMSLEEVLERRGVPTGNVAVALDFTVVPRGEWERTMVRDGSRIIVIKAVQGG